MSADVFSFEFVYKALKQLSSKCTCVCVRCRHNCGMRVVIIIPCLMYCYWQSVILYTSLIAINLFSRVNKILFSIIFAKHNGCMCNTLSFPPSLFLSIKVIIPTTELQRRTRTHLRFPVCPFLTLSSSFQPLEHFTKQLSHSRVKEKEEEEGEQEGVRERQRRVLSLWSA